MDTSKLNEDLRDQKLDLIFMLDGVLQDKQWILLFKLFFNFVFTRLKSHERDLYCKNIRTQYQHIIGQLSNRIYCQNCRTVFKYFDSIGSKSCRSHYGQLTRNGDITSWSCCGTIELAISPKDRKAIISIQQRNKSQIENIHFAKGCVNSDHWDLKAVRDESHLGSFQGFNRKSTISLPFLVYFLIIYEKYITTGCTLELENMFKSITRMTFTNLARIKIETKLSFSEAVTTNYSNQSQRNYDPFFNTSSQTDVFTDLHIPRTSSNTTPKPGVHYIDYLYNPTGIIELEKMIHNRTIPINDNVFDKFLFHNLLMLNIGAATGERREIFANFQNVSLIDLQSMNVEISRTTHKKSSIQ